MNKEEAKSVIADIDGLYQKFEITELITQIYVPRLMEMDYQGVMTNLGDFAASKHYPPTLAEIAAYPPEKNKHLEKIQQWEKEAEKVSEETKQQFKEQLQILIEVKGK